MVPSALSVRSMSAPARDVAEVVRGQVRQQREPHVGRRGAVRDDGNRMLLVIVGRQPVILRDRRKSRRTPRSCARPCAGRRSDPASAAPRGARAVGSATTRWRARRATGARIGAAAASAAGLARSEPERCGDGRDRADPHRATGGDAIVRSPQVARRGPFQQPGTREEHPAGRANDRVQAEERLVGQAREREGRLCQVARRRSAMPRRGAGATARRRACAASPGARRARQESGRWRARARLQPANSSATSASGARLRRRLSKIFHCDSHERGFL